MKQPESSLPNQNCAQCGANFRCGIAAGEGTCWCFALPALITKQEAEASEGCLCPACLQEKLAVRQDSGREDIE